MVTRTTDWRSVGDKVTVAFTINGTTAGTPTDSDVTFIVNKPTAVAVVAATTLSTVGGGGISRSTVGQYSYSWITTEPGEYTWAMRSTGAVVASTGGSVAVRALAAST